MPDTQVQSTADLIGPPKPQRADAAIHEPQGPSAEVEVSDYPDAPPLFDYATLQWELDEDPSIPHDYPSTQLFHLYTISGHLMIGLWSSSYTVAANLPHGLGHIVGWAAVDNELGTIQ